MNKILGYVISFAGILVLALSYEQVRKVLKVTLPSKLSNPILMIVGLALVFVGIFILFQNQKPKQAPEVPIYEGKNIVGFRRMGKK